MNSAKMRQDKMIDKMINNVKKFGDRLKFFDLDLLNITCNKISAIPFEYCVLENIYDEENIKNAPEYPWLKKVYSDEILLKAKKNPKIIHYAGKNPKIWLRKTKDIPKYYLKFIKESPFYNEDEFYATKQLIIKKNIYNILSKWGLTKSIRHYYRNKLNKIHY